MRIIAFGHRKRVGKDTAAKFLISHLRIKHSGINIEKAGFADKVKSVAWDLYKQFGLQSGDYYEDPKHEHLRFIKLPKINKTPVEIWIGIGNGLRASVYNGTWYDYLLFHKKVDVLVVKDMRFPIEAEGILDRGGVVYRIDKPDVQQDQDGADDQLLTFERWTGVIQNDSDLKSFHTKIVAIADSLF